MISLPRAIPFLKGLLALALVGLAVNGLLFAVDRWFPGWTRPIVKSGTEISIERMARRVDLAEAQYRNREVDEDRPLAILLGLSTLGEGIDLETLETADGAEYRYLQIAAKGVTTEIFSRCAAFVAESSLEPDLVILGLHPFFIVDRPGDLMLDEGEAALQSGEGGFAAHIRSSLTPWVWPMHHRNDLVRGLDLAVSRMRERVMTFLGRATPEEPEEEPDPWSQAFLRMRANTDAQWEDDAERRMATLQKLGKFDLEAYREYREASMTTLLQWIEEFKSRGSSVVVVVMPEHSRMRARIPEEAPAMLVDSLRATYGPDELPILDMSHAVPDEEYFDIAHANLDGALRLSRILGQWIAEGSERSGGAEPAASDSPQPVPAANPEREP